MVRKLRINFDVKNWSKNAKIVVVKIYSEFAFKGCKEILVVGLI